MGDCCVLRGEKDPGQHLKYVAGSVVDIFVENETNPQKSRQSKSSHRL